MSDREAGRMKAGRLPGEGSAGELG
jgi:hypothetical protein